MKLKRLFPVLLTFTLLIGAVGCTDVGVQPKDQVSSENAFQDTETVRAFLAKLYAGLSLTGQEGPAGSADLTQIDEGFSQYVRLWWQMQELPTDEAAIQWDDLSIQELNTSTWSASNGFASAMYARIFFQVSQTNEFLRQSTTQKLDEAGIRADIRPTIKQWRAEARFLRALSYWHAIDLFGGVPLVTEEDPKGVGEGESAPEKVSRERIFEFVENELLAITDDQGEENLPPAGQAEYARADKAAAWMVLSKLYLNAEVYTGTARYDDAVTFTNNIINAYVGSDPSAALEGEYHNLFLADNNQSDGIIFAVPQDGQRSQNFGNTTFLVNASTSPGALAGAVGVSDGGWAGVRTTAEVDSIYTSTPGVGSNESRHIYPNLSSIEGHSSGDRFFQVGHSREMTELQSFTSGFAAPKYQNITSGGQTGSSGEFPDTDFPMFRLADAYLMYAEAKLRGGAGGDWGNGLDLVNALRNRASSGSTTDLDAADLTLEYILNERLRELFWEATRRTDLIRYGLFTGGDYLWSFKGSESNQEGQSIPEFRALYPLPASEIAANPNLTPDDQNPGY
jgi:hypothetical protein